jgi:hypothetical protein
MRRVIEFVLAAIPLDARGRRAIDETLLDWSYEADRAATQAGRLWCGLRALASVGSTLASLAVAECADVPRSRWLLRFGVYLTAIAVLFTLNSSAHPVFGGIEPAFRQPVLIGLVFVGAAAVSAPVLLFLSTVPADRAGRRRTPFFGLAIAAFVAMIGVNGWAVPIANQEFRQTVFQANGGAGTIRPGPNELTLPQLFFRSEPPPGWRANAPFGRPGVRLGMAAAASVMVLLAAEVQRLSRRRRWLAAAGVLLSYQFLPTALSVAARLERAFTLAYVLPILGLVTITWLAQRRQQLGVPAAD